MRFLSRLSCLLAAVCALCGAATAQGTFQLKDGDRVVFYGDSLTDQRLYTNFVETYAVTRFPHLNIRFVNSGWGGERVTGGGGGNIETRLHRDVIPYKPTVVTILLGMNDGGNRAFDTGLFNIFTSGYQRIVETLKNALPGVRMTVIQPSPFDDVTRPPNFEGGYNAVMVRYGQWVKELAQRQGLTAADLNAPVVAMLQRARDTDAVLAQKIIADRIHPGSGGHMVMAGALLKAWNAPATVTSVEIDAVNQRVVSTENTVVARLVASRGLSWTQTDKALPLPINWNDQLLALAVRSSDFVKTLDQELLTVTGLTADRYVLKIDREEIGSFLKEQLAEGINLAVFNTPMAKQARIVQDLTSKHCDVHYARWREIQLRLQNVPLPHFEAALDDLDRLEAELIEQEYAAAQPKQRLYELTPEQ